MSIVGVVFGLIDFGVLDAAVVLFVWKYTCLKSPRSVKRSAQDPKNIAAINSVFVKVIFMCFTMGFLFCFAKYQYGVLISFAFFRKYVFFFTEYCKFLRAN
jgi:hypothetical protein